MAEAAQANATNNQPESAERLMSKAEVAVRLNRSLKTVTNWMGRGILPYYKLGHRVSFRWSEVMAHLEANYRRGRRQIWGQAHFPLTTTLSANKPVNSGAPLPRRGHASPRRGPHSRRS